MERYHTDSNRRSDMQSAMMTVEEVAKYLKMQTVTIYKHAKQGKIPAFKVGSSWRFKKSTIDEWITKQENSTNIK